MREFTSTKVVEVNSLLFEILILGKKDNLTINPNMLTLILLIESP